ncbi:MAG TPA: ABC transporter permease [Alphaproteobacteria bacterium]|nr:ABC transporter permease [Alphaproteobacteria bacterium]
MIRAINVIMLVVVLAPVVVVVWISFTPTATFVMPFGSLSLRWYREALSYPGFVDAFFLSVEVAAIASLITVAASFLAAYGLVRYPRNAAPALMGIFTAPLLVPAVVYGIAMLQFVNRIGLYNQLLGLVLAHAILVVPFAIRSLASTIRSVPEELEWAAMILGYNRVRMLSLITLPLCTRGIVTAGLFCFLLSFSEVTTTIFMSGPSLQTLPVRIYNYMSDRIDPTVAAVSALVVFVSLALVLILNLLGGFRRMGSRLYP